ncbi:hypothetical protein [Paenibacillus kobensis]|uniref:hypothetical protein n=1 Tax=Paenibacillus kobensis TaxID=59841 RepID=UPI000FDCB1CA|nr:hypothetical protein [Paenibacillus kobensis]
MPYIYISLIKTDSMIGKFVSYLKKDEVTHASIALDENLDELYGFGRKWNWYPFKGCFRRESYSEGYYGHFKTLPGVVLQLNITSNQYALVSQILNDFIMNSDQYYYSITKLLSNIIDVEIKDSRGFICSEFVAYILQEAGIVKFDRPLNLIRPQMLLKLPANRVYQGDLKRYGSANKVCSA